MASARTAALGIVRSLARPSSSVRRAFASSLASELIYRSPHAPVDPLPSSPSLYAHLFPPATAAAKGKPALDPSLPVFVDSSSGTELTRAELERSSALLGREIVVRLRLDAKSSSPAAQVDRGLQPTRESSADAASPTAPPPTVGLFLANGLAWPIAFLACQRAGLPTALFAASLTPTELAHQLKLARPGLTLTSTGLAPTLAAALKLVDGEAGEGSVDGKELETRRAREGQRTLVLPPPPAAASEEDPSGAAAPSVEGTLPFPTWSSLFNPPSSSAVVTAEVLVTEASAVVDAIRARACPAGTFSETAAAAAPAVVCFSSGTEGLSKGVETTHANLTSLLTMVHPPTVFPYIPPTPPRPSSFSSSSSSSSAESDDAGGGMLAVLPFSHIYGLFKLVLMPLVHGFRAVVVPRVDLRTIGGAVERCKPSCAILVPPILIHFAQSKALDRYDLSSLDWLLSGAAPLGKELAQAVEARFAGQNLTLLQGFGLTETSPVTHILQLTNARQHPGSIGQLVPNVEARLVDEHGRDSVGTTGGTAKWPEGELWVRGPNVMRGYLRNPSATEATFASAADGGPRWLKTGDIATVDPEGYFYIIDRRKELIKYNGHQVAPAELEALLLTHPQVADVGVIGVQSAEEKVEVPRAYVVLKPEAVEPGAERDFALAAVRWVQQRVAPHKYLRGGVHLIDQIPKSPSGKILRRRLRDLAREGEKASGS